MEESCTGWLTNHTHGTASAQNAYNVQIFVRVDPMEIFIRHISNGVWGVWGQMATETGANMNVQSDWDATSGNAVILNKPTIQSIVNKYVFISGIDSNNFSVSNFAADKSIAPESIISITVRSDAGMNQAPVSVYYLPDTDTLFIRTTGNPTAGTLHLTVSYVQ